jgi:esterase/lipase
MKEEKIYFENNGQKIVGILHIPDNENFSAIIMCHGFTANMNEDHNLFIKIAKKLCENGFTVLRFDFRGSGKSEGEFIDMTISGEVSDLKEAIEFILKQKINKDKIGVLGLSLGSVVSILGWDERIKALVLLSPANDSKKVFIKGFGEKTVKEIEEKGFVDLQKVPEGWRTQTSFKVGKKFLEEIRKTKLINNIKFVKCPILIIQGKDDEDVDWHDSKELYSLANKPKEIKLIENADHTFDNPEHEKKVIELSLDWFKKYLR